MNRAGAPGHRRRCSAKSIGPDSDPANVERLAALLAYLDARHVGLGDLHADEFPFDPDEPRRHSHWSELLEPRLGGLDIMQWVPGVDAVRLTPSSSRSRSRASSTESPCACAASATGSR